MAVPGVVPAGGFYVSHAPVSNSHLIPTWLVVVLVILVRRVERSLT